MSARTPLPARTRPAPTVEDAAAPYWAARRTAASDGFRAARDLLLRHRSDLDTAAELFRWPRPEHFNWALEWFDVVAAGNARPALELLDRDGGAESVSYEELSRRSDAVAVWLTGLGVRRGDRVMVVLGTQRELWEVLLAGMKTGAVLVPCHPELTAAEAADRVGRGRIDHVVCRASSARVFAGVPVPGLRICVSGRVPGWTDYRDALGETGRFFPDGPTPSNDVAFCYFTSGTTSAPKLVAHTHLSYPAGHLSSLYWNGLLPGDRHVNVSSPGWAKHSWSSFFVPWNAEATIVALPEGPPDPALLPGILRDRAADSFCAPPSLWQALRPHLGAAAPRLREATSAGEPLPPGLADEIRSAWGVPVRDGYGQTETTALIGTTPGTAPRAGLLGRPLPGYRIVLCDPDSGEPSGSGEICVELDGERPVGVMAGYLEDPERTERVLGQGRYATGDLGERTPDGWIRVLGRRDDVFKSYGHRVSPYEAEAALRTHPAVAEVAVVPVDHPEGGLVPLAVVVPAPGHEPDGALAARILAHAALALSSVARPERLRFAAGLPRTASSKIRRREVRELFAGPAGPAPYTSGTGTGAGAGGGGGGGTGAGTGTGPGNDPGSTGTAAAPATPSPSVAPRGTGEPTR
ncbi:AMP-binding protein [Streptomyces sp. ISL-66]|uniref:acyl-CoA synthetase n=1 Tax=Streptomyces sp. ISL-66 TaxID=2819186 RepID=UPI001BECA4B9|nr:AMP-binding protein [Streptomyces sp. ISL-66]MBT2467889.1 AMP-binding protein [Streptomyces sp. ISL-66]